MSYGSPAWADLIAQIRRDPRSLELRDIAADYLLEHQDPRGEFIVLRNRLAAGNIPPSEYISVYDRHRELSLAEPWKKQLDALPMRWRTPFVGFVEYASVEREGFEQLDLLCRHEPITQLDCSRLGELTAALLDTPELDDLELLELSDKSAGGLLASHRLANVRTLRVHDATCFDHFAASTVRPHRLEVPYLSADAMYRLSGSPILDELRQLPFETDEFLLVIGEHPLAKLERLDMMRLTSFARVAPLLDQLVSLRAGSLALPVVTANVRSGNLRELSLVIAEVDIPMVVEMIDSAACLQLEKLTIRGLPLPLAIEQAIRRLAFHGHLREILVQSRRGGRIQVSGVHVIEVS